MEKINPLSGKKSSFSAWIVPVFLCLLLASEPVLADEPADSVLVQQIRFLNKSLQYDQQGTKLWWYSWLGFYSAATLGQGAVYFSSEEKSTRQDMALGAATTFVGVIGQIITPFRPISFADKLSMLPEVTATEKQDKLSQMEKLLADRAWMESEARKWKAHILPTSINLVSGLVTWLGFHRTVWDGVVNFGLNCVITETQIWTQPIRAKRALRHYHENFGTVASHPKRDINCNFIVSGSGAGIRVVF